jgi:hypothetical protein
MNLGSVNYTIIAINQTLTKPKKLTSPMCVRMDGIKAGRKPLRRADEIEPTEPTLDQDS